MIAHLRGRLVAADVGQIVVDVGGVGYRLLVPSGAFQQHPGEDVAVHTYLAVREDALTLYGFPDHSTLDLFERLIGVNGVGPKLALAALAGLGADGVRHAIAGEDVDRLTAVPGLGRKTAQRLILELQGALEPTHAESFSGNGAPADGPALGDVRVALAGLGYSAAEINEALGAVTSAAGEEAAKPPPGGGERNDDSPDVLLRRTLQHLARST